MSKVDVYVRRRSWNSDEKRAIVTESFSDGVAAVARRHGLQPHQIYYWRQKMSARACASGFVKVEVSGSNSTSTLPVPFSSPTGEVAPLQRLPSESVEIAMPCGLALRVPISAGAVFVADVALSLSRRPS